MKIRFNAIIECDEETAENLNIENPHILGDYVEHMLGHSDLSVDVIDMINLDEEE